MPAILIVLLILVLIFLLSLMGRTGHKGLEPLRGWRYAHRGLHGNGIPENSMAAFRKALEHGFGIELDVHLMKDGTLAVIHDASLKRTAGAAVRIEELTAEDLENYRLEGTDEKIPTLEQVLDLFAGKAPMIVEIKSVNNAAAVSEAVCNALANYSGPYCLESFDPRCIHWLKKNRPEEIRGQLSENFVRNKRSRLKPALKWAMTTMVLNIVNRPDFVAYKFSDRKLLPITLCRKLWRIQGVTWTITSAEDLATAEKEGWIPIFEKFLPEK